MSWIKNNSEGAYIVFDGAGTDRDSWFSVARILDSTWSPSIVNDAGSLEPPSAYG